MKALFNFYLDDMVKEKAIEKVEKICGKQEKGQLASLIRVLLKRFLACDDSDELDDIAEEVESEYVTSQLKNKRSVM